MKAHIITETRKEFFEYWEGINPAMSETHQKEKKFYSFLPEEALNMASTVVSIINIPDKSYHAIGGTVSNWKHKTSNWLKEGISLSEANVSPLHDDFVYQFAYRKFFETYYATSIEERKNIEFFWDIFYRNENVKKGEYIRLFEYTRPFEIDSKGNLFFTINIAKNITFLKKNRNASAVIKKADGKYYFYKYEDLERCVYEYCLSDRMKNIVVLLSKGLSSKEIATILFISHHTVDTHRREWLEMTNCIDTTGLIIYCQMLGIV